MAKKCRQGLIDTSAKIGFRLAENISEKLKRSSQTFEKQPKYTSLRDRVLNSTPGLFIKLFFDYCETYLQKFLVKKTTHLVFETPSLFFGQRLSLATSHACADTIPTCPSDVTSVHSPQEI